MESFNLNIIPGKDRPVCHASQYDIGRTIHVNLFEGFNVFTLDGTETISISVRKPDGNVVTESVTNTSDSYVEFVTTEQMTACHGSNLCELKLEKGADVIGTMNFILEVEQDPLDGGVQSDTQIHNLQTQVAGMVAIEVADQYDSANVIFDAVPTAGHGVGYAVTSEGIKNEFDALPQIDDNSTSATGLWSSDKTNTELLAKQDATDSNLQTTDQTVVGAINEIKANIDFNSYNAVNWGTYRGSLSITGGQWNTITNGTVRDVNSFTSKTDNKITLPDDSLYMVFANVSTNDGSGLVGLIATDNNTELATFLYNKIAGQSNKYMGYWIVAGDQNKEIALKVFAQGTGVTATVEIDVIRVSLSRDS